MVTAEVIDPVAQMETQWAMPPKWVELGEKVSARHRNSPGQHMLGVMEYYWIKLVASGHEQFDDQLDKIPGVFLHYLVQEEWEAADVLAGIDWLFGDSGCKHPNKYRAVLEYVRKRSHPDTVREFEQLPHARPGFWRGRMAS